MGKNDAINELMKLRDKVDRLPRFKGRADLIRKIQDSVEHLRIYKSGVADNLPELFLEECNKAFESGFQYVEELDIQKEERRRLKETKRRPLMSLEK